MAGDVVSERLIAAAEKAEASAEILRRFKDEPQGSYIETESGPLPSLAEFLSINAEKIGNLEGIEEFISELQSVSDPKGGAEKVTYKGRPLFDTLDSVVNIQDAPFNVKGDNTTADHQRLIQALEYGASTGRVVIVPPGVFQFNNWIPLPDKLKMAFMPGARWKLTATTVLGGFVCGGYTSQLVRRPYTSSEIYGIDLDCSDLPNENGFNAINAVNVKLYNPKVRNVKFSTVNQGGKAFQFEGDVVDGLQVYSPYIENCTIGINSHADPLGGTEIARNISYFNVVMRNVDVPFNLDGQFANPEQGSLANMNTTVYGVQLFNCGRLTFPGASSPLGGGIVCGDRGQGLRIYGLRAHNDTAYGAIGAVVRGTLFDVQLKGFQIDVPEVSSVVDLTPVGYGLPSSGAHVCRIELEAEVIAKITRIVTGYANGKVGTCFFNMVLDSVKAQLTQLADAQAASGGMGYMKISLKNAGQFTTGIQSISSLVTAGNSLGSCLPDQVEGSFSPADASGAGLAITVTSARYVRARRIVLASFQIDYPTTASTANAKIGGLPFDAMAGGAPFAVTFGFKGAAALATGLLRAGTKAIELYTSAGAPITNQQLSGQTLIATIQYMA